MSDGTAIAGALCVTLDLTANINMENYTPNFLSKYSISLPQPTVAFPPLKPFPQFSQMRTPDIGETGFFNRNLNVAGMATPDNKVIFSPTFQQTASPLQKKGLYFIESARNHMKQDDSWKKIEFTPEQEKWFKSLGDEYYSKMGDYTKQTLVSRILGGDEIPDAPFTPEQYKIADSIWNNMLSETSNKK